MNAEGLERLEHPVYRQAFLTFLGFGSREEVFGTRLQVLLHPRTLRYPPQ